MRLPRFSLEKPEKPAKPLFSNADLLRLFLPLGVEQFLGFLVGFAATLFVSSSGEAAVSGVSLVDSIMMLLIAAFSALATGGSVVAGQYLGSGRTDKAQEASARLVWLAGGISVGVTALMYVAAPFILDVVFGRISPEVRGHAATYLSLVNASIPAIALYAAGAAIFRTIGKTAVTMNVAIFMNVANIAGSAILVFGFRMGTVGVGIASLASRCLAAVLMLALATDRKLSIRLPFAPPPRSPEAVAITRSILGIGLPFALENSLFQIGRIIALSLISTFGTAAITANAVGTAVALFQILPGAAIMLGLTTVISRCVGAGDFGQARYYHRKIVWITYAANLVSILAILALLPAITRAYGLSETTAALVILVLSIHGISALVVWPLSFTIPVTLRAAGDARFPMVVSILSMALGRLLPTYILGSMLGMGLAGAWIAMLFDWGARAVIFALRYRGGKWTGFRVVG